MIPGKYTIEVQKDGCHPQSRQVELKDNDTLQVDFPALKTITGSLRVDYEPAGADVLLNGKKVGVTPLVLKELLVGDYHLEIWKEYYVKEFVNVKIAEDQEWKESGELKLTQFGELVVNAENGTDHGQDADTGDETTREQDAANSQNANPEPTPDLDGIFESPEPGERQITRKSTKTAKPKKTEKPKRTAKPQN